MKAQWGLPPSHFPLPTSYFPLPTSHFILRTYHFRLLTSHFILPTSYFPLPTSHFRLPTSHFLLPTSDFSLPTSYFPLPTSHFSLPTSHFLLPTSHFRLPTSHFRLPTSHFLLPTSYFPLPTSHFLLPTSHFPLLTSHFPLLPFSFHVCTWSIGCGLSIWLLLRLLLLVSVEYISQHCFFGGYRHMYVVIFLCTLMYMVTKAYAILPRYLPAATGGQLSRDEIIKAYFQSVYANRDIVAVLFMQQGIRLSYRHLKRLWRRCVFDENVQNWTCRAYLLQCWMNWQLVVNVEEAYSFHRLHLYMWSEGKFSNLCGYWTLRALKGVKHTRPCNEHNPPMCTPLPPHNSPTPTQIIQSNHYSQGPTGIPDGMFFMPQLYQTQSYASLIGSWRGSYLPLPKTIWEKTTNHGCCGKFYEVVTMLRSNLVISTSGEDALDLFMALTQEIRQYQ